VLKEGLEAAYRRALANADGKAETRGKFGPLGESLADTRLHPIRVCQDTVPAVYEIDPRTVDLGAMVRFTEEISRRIKATVPAVGFNYVSTMTQLSRELFASSEGALIDQAFALTQGMGYVVANGADNSQEIYDVVGHQRAGRSWSVAWTTPSWSSLPSPTSPSPWPARRPSWRAPPRCPPSRTR